MNSTTRSRQKLLAGRRSSASQRLFSWPLVAGGLAVLVLALLFAREATFRVVFEKEINGLQRSLIEHEEKSIQLKKELTAFLSQANLHEQAKVLGLDNEPTLFFFESSRESVSYDEGSSGGVLAQRRGE